MSRRVVIDANRIFSELIAENHQLRRVFASEPDAEFLCPKYVLVELFKHKERIAAASGLDETDLLALLHTLWSAFIFTTRTPSASEAGPRHGGLSATWMKTTSPMSRSPLRPRQNSGPAIEAWRRV
jgi:hypothetical protein